MIRTTLTVFWALGVLLSKAENFHIANQDVEALRQAIITSNTNNQADNIFLSLKGTYTLTVPVQSFNGEDSGLPDIWEDQFAFNQLVIVGNGSVIERSLSASNYRIIKVVTGTVSMYDNHFKNGYTALGKGSGIMNSNANLKMYNCTLSNHRGAFEGGAIYSGTAYTRLTNCTITQCQAASGSALFFYSSNGDIINCTISSNVGIETYTKAVTSAVPSFVNYNYVTTLYNTIVANNLTSDSKESDLGGAILSGSKNIIGAVDDPNTPMYFPVGNPNANGDYIGTQASPADPLLNPLGNYGGLTPTISLQSSSSIAYNKGSNGIAPPYDQAGNNRSGNADIGSMEYINDFPFLNPKFSVLQDNVAIPTQTGEFEFQALNEGEQSEEVPFVIKNTNTSTYKLRLLSNPLVFISGPDSLDFVVITDTLRSELEGSDYSGFQIIFKPLTHGAKTAKISIASNDATVGVYEFSVKGTANELVSGIDVSHFSNSMEVLADPNPSSGKFTLVVPSVAGEMNVKVIDSYGKLILERALASGAEIDLSKQRSGAYYLLIQHKGLVGFKKIIIQ